METLHFTREPVATTGMLIRRPVEDVFDAFVNPEITTKFWFNRSDGRIVVGKPVNWHWDNYGLTIRAVARKIERPTSLVVEWSAQGTPTVIEWMFTPVPDGAFVEVTNRGFSGSGDERVKQAVDSAQGFSFVLAGLKALLEHGLQLNLIADRYPQGVAAH